jgi:ABC-type branched-subunit amino acid transport system ATPase component
MSDLEVRGVTVSFGGLQAVSDVSLRAPQGRITGLIGPNGAGKTTTFNACTGLVKVDSGTVHLGGDEVTHAPPHRRAQLGLGRTFQRMALFNSLSVADNVALGREAGLAGSRPWRHLRATRAGRRLTHRSTAEALRLCGIENLAQARPPQLSTGQRRLVELARVLAGDFSTLLLDEPSSGLDEAESAAFGDILLAMVRERGVGILVVEHDMKFVAQTCAHVHMLDFGKPIFEGTTAEMAVSPIVKAAYLGSTDLGAELEAAQ